MQVTDQWSIAKKWLTVFINDFIDNIDIKRYTIA